MKHIIVVILLLGSFSMMMAQNKTYTTKIEGACGMCKDRIEEAALNTIGVTTANWDEETGLLNLEVSAAFIEMDLHNNIAKVGHDTPLVKAPEEVYNKLPKCCLYKDANNPHKKNNTASTQIEDETFVTKVEGACGMCKDRIEEAALSTIDVLSANWDEKTQLLTLKVSSTFQENELHSNISKAGHDTEKMKADDKVYHALPLCCNYRTEHDESEHEEQAPKTKKDFIQENPVDVVQGIIYELDKNSNKVAIIGANINWINEEAKGTISRADGSFSIPLIPGNKKLIISYMGYASDTLTVDKAGTLEVALTDGVALNEVVVRGRKRSVEVSYISPIKLRKISQRELTKAACCNLSESFETNPAIDVSFTDAVTGTKQIEMLGLAGPYVQITRENMPDVRGLAAVYGLGFIPGPWIESIQLNLGTGSVVNGFESIAGQINVELRKPTDKEKLHVNGYYGSGGRYEANVAAATSVNDHFDTNVLLHYNIRNQAHDNNFDGFLDNPKGYGYSLSNNWKYFGKDGNEGQFGFKITKSDNNSGQDLSHHGPDVHPPGYVLWKANINADRYEAYIKRGKAFLDKENTSIGFQLGGIYYDHKSNFGNRIYNGDQKMLYANLIYQTIIKNPSNKISMGSSFQAEITDEILDGKNYERKESVPGIFGEYTYSKNEKIDLVFGLRGDYHNNFGFFMTPRFHSRYAFSEATVLRASMGRGQRTANIIAENIGGLASSRKFIVEGQNNNNPYGLDAEVAWNYGVNLTHDFSDKIQYSLDIYSTNFQNQIVVDYDRNPQEVNFYNLKGKSYSHSFQTQVDWTIIERLDVRLAYRFNNVKTDFSGNLRYKPMTSSHRSFGNIAYETKNGWKFDYTINWQSSKRLPITSSNPENFRLPERSESFFVSNAQITKVFGKKYEFYFGGENIFDFIQPNTIISGGEPFGQNFDASIVWGPVFGRMFYGGFRYRLMDN